ncbi:MAG: hypothetical protein RBS37_02850 [Bacteroidales bacterium]|jgi:hypothetical protein|nr:hypothetical protein [Bacteroidales bacterium]
MINRKLIAVMLFIAAFLELDAQTNDKESRFGIQVSGFVRNDFFLDSRLTVASREGSFLLWPENVLPDDSGGDINDLFNFNFLSVNTRLTANITGPDAFGARISGLIETDFFGQANDNIGMLRLRHALVRMNWENSELLIGQYWNPLFITANYPSTVSLNAGTPFNSFARNPQIRFTARLGKMEIIAAALAQRDYANYASGGPGLAATASPSYLRNSARPDLHLQVHYQFSSGSGAEVAFGAASAYKRIVPRLIAGGYLWPLGTIQVDEKVDGFTAVLFGRISTQKFTLKLYTRYGENITDLLAPGGYAAIIPPEPGIYSLDYIPLRSISYWFDISAAKGRLQPGLFAGYLVNRGSGNSSVTPALIFGRVTDIGSMVRISPRVNFTSGRIKLSGEMEFTRANYGNGTYNAFAIPQDQNAVDNFRILSTVIFSF